MLYTPKNPVNYGKYYAQAQKQLKISKVNKPQESAAIRDLVLGFQEAQKSPTMQAVAKSLGISNFNSINDYMQLRNHLSAPKPAAPAAPAPAPPPPAAPTAPSPSLESEKYRAEAQSYMQQADALLKKFQVDQSNAAAAAAAQRAKDEEAVKLREQMFIQSQTTAAANMARAGKTPNLQIQPASGTPEMAGTQGFRRRKQQFNQLSSGGLSALNIQTPSTLNV
jgi:hypothetical protein